MKELVCWNIIAQFNEDHAADICIEYIYIHVYVRYRTKHAAGITRPNDDFYGAFASFS